MSNHLLFKAISNVADHVTVMNRIFNGPNADFIQSLVWSYHEGHYTALQFASMLGLVSVAKYLVQIEKVDINACSLNGVSWRSNMPPLVLAAALGHVDMVKYLAADVEMDVNKVVMFNRTAIDYTYLVLTAELSARLLQSESVDDVSTREGEVLTKKVFDSIMQFTETLKVLVDNGARIERVNTGGFTVLQEVRYIGHCFFDDPTFLKEALNVLGLCLPVATIPATSTDKNEVSVNMHPHLDCEQKRAAAATFHALYDAIDPLPENICYAVLGYLSFCDLPISATTAGE